MRDRENWDVLCEVCDKTITCGVATESGDNIVTHVTANSHTRTNPNKMDQRNESGNSVKRVRMLPDSSQTILYTKNSKRK